MSDRQLPERHRGDALRFDHRRALPLLRRGLDRLAEYRPPAETELRLLWTFKGYGRKNVPGEEAIPEALPVLPRNIPAELKERRQWVCWDWARRGEQWGKPPLSSVTGGNASETDPETWGSFDQAMAFAAANNLPGIGFVLTESDPYVGVDLDDCRDPETGELEPWAVQIVAALSSYTEVSPSGRGVHVLVRGSLSPRKRSLSGVRPEVYDCDRYLTITGQHLRGTPRAIQQRQYELDGLVRKLSPMSVSLFGDTRDESIRSATLDGDRVLIFTWHGVLYSVDTATGTVRSIRHVDELAPSADAFDSSVLSSIETNSDDDPTNDCVYLSDNRANQVHAFDASRGATRWIFAYRGRTTAESGLRVMGGNAYLLTDEMLYCIEPATGSLRWLLPIPGEATWAFLVPSTYIAYRLVASRKLYVRDAVTGVEHWCVDDAGWVRDPLIANGVVYVGAQSPNVVVALDLLTRCELWRFAVPGDWGVYPIDIINGVIMVMEWFGDNLYALEAGTGEELWKFHVTDIKNPWLSSHIVYLFDADGILYVLGIDGDLSALDIATGVSHWRLPVFDNLDPDAIKLVSNRAIRDQEIRAWRRTQGDDPEIPWLRCDVKRAEDTVILTTGHSVYAYSLPIRRNQLAVS